MSGSNYHRNHAKHISFSERLHENLQKTGQDLLNSLNQQPSDLLIIKVINIIVGGIYAVIPDLQEIVIKNHSHEKNNADLKDVGKKLSQYTNDMVQADGCDSNTQLQKLKNYIQNILREGENVLSIIKKDDLHDFKHELVAHLKEIMFTIERAQVRIQVEGYTQQELKNIVEGLQQDNLKEFSTIENCKNLELLKAMAIHIKHIAKHDLHLAFYLNKVASNFPDVEIQNKITTAANILNAATADVLHINNKLTNPKETVAALTRWCLDGWSSVADLYHFIDNRHADNRYSENLKDIIKSVVSHGIVITIHTRKAIQHESAVA